MITPPRGLRNSFVRRNVDQTNYHLHNTATDLTLPKPKFVKRTFEFSSAMLWKQLPNEAKLAESISSFKSLIRLWYCWVLTSYVSYEWLTFYILIWNENSISRSIRNFRISLGIFISVNTPFVETRQVLLGLACFSCDMNFYIKYYLPTSNNYDYCICQ